METTVPREQRTPPPPAPANRTLHWVLWSALVLVLGGLAAAGVRQQWRGAQRRDFTRLDHISQVPTFTLTERSGRTFNSDELHGKIWLANFFFTACPGPCLRMNSRMQELQESLGKAGPELRLVSFTVNPEGDTPEKLRRYADKFHAAPDRWFFLTGERPKIYAVARQGFKFAVQEAEDGSSTPEQPVFVHSTMIALVDRQGVMRGYYDSAAPDVVQRVLTDIGNLLREQPHA